MTYSGNYDDVDGLYEEALDLATIDELILVKEWHGEEKVLH